MSATVHLTGEYRFIVASTSGDSVICQIATVDVDPTFTKITEGPHVTDSGNARQASWGDYDNDDNLHALRTSFSRRLSGWRPGAWPSGPGGWS